MAGKGEKATIVIRREEVVEAGHHGGAWKVAYADFVTAMMAFFLLMWLLNATTEQQRRGIADYFSPNASISHSPSGYGLPFGGRTPSSTGSLASDRGVVQVGRPQAPVQTMDDEPEDPTDASLQARPGTQDDAGPLGTASAPSAQGGPHERASNRPRTEGSDTNAGPHPNAPTQAEAPNPTDQDLQAELDKRERAAFERAAQQIRDAVRADPALADLARQLMIDITPEGLRIQLLDEERLPMFSFGSAALNDRARAMLAKVAPVLLRLPQSISIAGHTDGAPYRGGDRSNWDLSAERANATRRVLVESGLPEGRVRSVAGLADRDPLMPDDRMNAANRRIAITVLHEPRPAPR